MKNGLVECQFCQSNVSPRLWHNHIHSWLFKTTTAHICPICGKTMYRSGKPGLEPLPLFLISAWLFVTVIAFLISSISAFFHYVGLNQSFSISLAIILLSATLLTFLTYKYPRIKREFNYIKAMIKTYF